MLPPISASIHIAPMGDRENQQAARGIIDLIDDAIISNPNAIQIGRTGEFHAARGPSVLLQAINGLAQPPVRAGIAQGAEEFLSSPAEQNRIASNLAFTCSQGSGSSASPNASRAAFRSAAFSSASSSAKSWMRETTC